ncbi:hypothetical protein AMTR_s00174p00055720 [Amborella trichopoda]|uniref:Bifunctional inhibitor/plant lipid transfer protein/seed storage helical domain-containing protein n=2 Tax=Amborella trichopoda TaxID=13333 RepID=U5CMW1_AMBTC|nr:hypothetical protein AMTR_s00174p00055720 [Amborella trichopoda]
MAQIRVSGLAILAMVVLSNCAADAQLLLCAQVNVLLLPCRASILDSTILPTSTCCSSLQALAILSVGPPDQRKGCCQCCKNYLLSLNILIALNLFNQCNCNPGFPLDPNFDCNS